MANWIEAVNRYRPRVTNAPTIDIDFLAERLSVGTLITRPLARMVLEELGREVAGLLRTGHKVRLPGIGTLAPRVRLGGRMHPAIRFDEVLKRSLSTVDAFLGAVEHRESVGLDLAALKVRWDAEYPDDPLELPLLEELVACGAPPAIVYDSGAHIGTDKLHRLLPRLRARLMDLGVSFHFDTRLTGLRLDAGGGRVRAVVTDQGELPCAALVLAIGHSARDTWAMLAAAGLAFEAKPFQLGLRIEHPQELIDRGRYGGPIPQLGAASYNLVSRATPAAAAAHSFCMCPGGRVVASISEPHLLCTNGMSNASHSSAWASAAIVTTVGPEQFGAGAFDGVAFQRALEARCFAAGGGDYTAPAQGAADFLAGRPTTKGLRHSTYPFGTVPGRLDELLPPAVRDAVAQALLRFDRLIPGYAGNEGQLLGLESRSSGPVRMPRDPVTRRAVGLANVYPVGEGAGYALSLIHI